MTLILACLILFENTAKSQEFPLECSISDYEVGFPSNEPANLYERFFIYSSLEECKHGVPDNFNFILALDLLRQDKNMSLHSSLIGISLATWCIEGGLRTKNKNGGPIMGDYREGRVIFLTAPCN